LRDTYGVHFIHVRGAGPNPIPLIITHGWPGSFVEMLDVLPLLTNPAANGGDPFDNFDVVIPSLPGFGFSDRPDSAGMNMFRIADIWTALMEELGYNRFAAQGGDLGAGVSTALGLRHGERILGIHLNYIPGSYRPHIPDGDMTSPEERDSLAKMSQWAEENGAYAHLQSTRPRTAAYGLNDSPVGLAAWILEKMHAWSDCEGDLLSLFTRDQLLTNLTLYWSTESIFSSFRIYYEARKAPLAFGPGDRVSVPCAIAHFPKELPFPSRALIERGFNVRRWSEMPKGGHFAAMEQPELFVSDVREFFRPFRQREAK
jgi:pimeloyl-ACP methyl ester carboxylesterase